MQRKKTHTIDNSLLSKRANAANVCVRWPRCSGSYSASVAVFVLQQLDVMAVTAAMARTNGNRKSRRRDDCCGSSISGRTSGPEKGRNLGQTVPWANKGHTHDSGVTLSQRCLERAALDGVCYAPPNHVTLRVAF